MDGCVCLSEEINQKVTRFWVKCTVLRRECTLTHHYQGNIDFNTALSIRDVRGGAFSSGVGRGEDENPRGGPERGVNQLIQTIDKSA